MARAATRRMPATTSASDLTMPTSACRPTRALRRVTCSQTAFKARRQAPTHLSTRPLPLRLARRRLDLVRRRRPAFHLHLRTHRGHPTTVQLAADLSAHHPATDLSSVDQAVPVRLSVRSSARAVPTALLAAAHRSWAPQAHRFTVKAIQWVDQDT